MSKLSLFMVFCGLTIVIPNQAIAEGQLRDALKEKMKGRIISKIEEKRLERGEVGQKISSVSSKEGNYTYSLSHDGLVRKYIVHVPTSYNPAVPLPMLVAFHGGGGDMTYMSKDEFYGLSSKANKEGFIVVYPSGYSKFNSGKFATWNAGNCCGDARDKKIDDVGFIRKMVKEVEGRYNIDRSKIFATGMSNGGMISYVMACELSDVFRGIAAVAGTDNTASCSHKNPVSILHIHAQNDTHVLFNGGAGEDAFRDTSKVTNFTSVPETIDRWLGYNQCNAQPKRVLTVKGAYCDLYEGCNSGAKVKLCVTETGAHSWPGGYKPRGEPTSQAISANDVMWDFFMGLK